MSYVARRVELAPPLEGRFRELLTVMARARKFPTVDAPIELGARVAELSRSYNTEGTAPPASLAARLGFSFARDVPKGGAAVAELILRGALSLDRGPLTVLDYGAGLGATTWGLVRALAAAGQRGTVDAYLYEPDKDALQLAIEIARRAERERDVELTVRGDASLPARGKRFDVVLMGQVLSELSLDADARIDALEARVSSLLKERLEDDGALVIIEPALSDRTRTLMELRDRLVAKGHVPFAPCPHARACPMWPSPRDWCHEDLPIDLPDWLVPVARAAGLRYERLTFSYLVLTRRKLEAPRGARLVRQPKITKGKREFSLCTPSGELAQLTRLDRHRAEPNEALDDAGRGDLVDVEPFPPGLRIERDTHVELLDP